MIGWHKVFELLGVGLQEKSVTDLSASPTNQQKDSFHITRRRALVWAGLIFIGLLLAWVQLGHWYQTHLLEEQRAKILIQLAPYGNALTKNINRRFAMLDGMATFVHNALDSEGELRTERFEDFAAGLSSPVEGVRGLSVAPDAVQLLIYPPSGNERTVGANLLEPSSRPGVVEDVRRAIRLRTVTVTGVYLTRDGVTPVFTARLPLFREEDFWGLVTMVLEITPILEEAGIRAQLDGMTVALRDASG
jgi:sensor domain CHASE-containing protein